MVFVINEGSYPANKLRMCKSHSQLSLFLTNNEVECLCVWYLETFFFYPVNLIYNKHLEIFYIIFSAQLLIENKAWNS